MPTGHFAGSEIESCIFGREGKIKPRENRYPLRTADGKMGKILQNGNVNESEVSPGVGDRATQKDRLNRYARLIERQTGKAVRPLRMDGYANMLNRYGTSRDVSERKRP